MRNKKKLEKRAKTMLALGFVYVILGLLTLSQNAVFWISAPLCFVGAFLWIGSSVCYTKLYGGRKMSVKQVLLKALFEEKGVAVLPVIFIVILASVIVTPLIVDTIDVGADSPLSGIERLGEGMKSIVMGGPGWEADRALERAQEFKAICDATPQRADDCSGLVDESNQRMEVAIQNAPQDTYVIQQRQKCLTVLESVKEKLVRITPNQSRAVGALDNAIWQMRANVV